MLDYTSETGVSEMLMNEPHMQNSPLYRRNGIPLYHQIQQRLLDQIQSGVFKPSEPIPSIQKIAERMGVSQMTTSPDERCAEWFAPRPVVSLT